MNRLNRPEPTNLPSQAKRSTPGRSVPVLVGACTLVVAGLVVILATRPTWVAHGWDAVTSAFRSDTVAVGPRLVWPVGVENQYTFELESSVKHGPSNADLMQVKLRGELAIACLKPGLLRAAFTGDVLEMSGVDTGDNFGDAQREELYGQLRAPFHIYLDEHGRLVKVRPAPGSYEFVTRLWHGTAAALQFVSPSPPERDRWTAVETDTVGEYDAVYQKSAANQYVRQKQRYTNAQPLKNSEVTYSIDQSRTSFQLGDGQTLRSLSLDERLAVRNAPLLGSMRTATRIRLTRQRDRRVAELVAAWLEEAKISALEEPSDDQATLLDQARAQGMKWPEILAHIRRLTELSEPSEDDRNLLGRARIALKATLRLHPEYIETAEQGVLEQGPLAREFLNALRDANTPKATGALVRLARNDTFDSRERLRVTTALSLTKAATPESLATLRELRANADVREQATYGVGSAVHSLAQSADPAAGDGLSYLLSELESSQDEYEGRALLEALGNAGQPDSIPVIAQYAGSSSPRLRGGASQALRRIDTPAADELLAQLLLDPDATVRGLTLDALSGRSPSAAVASLLPRVIREDSSAANRIRAIRVASAWRTSYADLANAIQAAALNDPMKAVRDTAERALRSSS